MSAEWLTAIATVISVFVIALSAVAGVRQITHLRTANQSAALLTFTARFNEPEVRAAASFVRDGGLERACDAFATSGDRAALRLAAQPATPVLYFWEAIGSFVFFRMLDAEIVLGTFDPLGPWRSSERYIRLVRTLTETADPYDKFEALVALRSTFTPRPVPQVTPEVSRRLGL